MRRISSGRRVLSARSVSDLLSPYEQRRALQSSHRRLLRYNVQLLLPWRIRATRIRCTRCEFSLPLLRWCLISCSTLLHSVFTVCRCMITDVEIINQLAVAQSKLRRSDFSRRTLHALLIVRAAASALAEHAPSRCSQVSYMWIVSLHFIGRQRATEFGAFAGLFELVHDCELALFLRQTYLVPGFCLSSIALLVSRRLNLCAQKYAGVSQSSAARASNPTSNSLLQGQVHDCAHFALLVC